MSGVGRGCSVGYSAVPFNAPQCPGTCSDLRGVCAVTPGCGPRPDQLHFADWAAFWYELEANPGLIRLIAVHSCLCRHLAGAEGMEPGLKPLSHHTGVN